MSPTAQPSNKRSSKSSTPRTTSIAFCLALISTLFTPVLAFDFGKAEYRGPYPIPSDIQLTPADLKPENSMMTANLDWHKKMALAFISARTTELHKWGAFDVTFDSSQMCTVSLYKYTEGGYESPSDCFDVCEKYLGDAMGAGVQGFQCDHRPAGGGTHCWMGYGPRVH